MLYPQVICPLTWLIKLKWDCGLAMLFPSLVVRCYVIILCFGAYE
jgi:hypothetical protein